MLSGLLWFCLQARLICHFVSLSESCSPCPVCKSTFLPRLFPPPSCLARWRRSSLFLPRTLLCFWFVASPHRLVVPNKGYSSLDQSPDEKPLVALDTDRWIQTQNLIWEMLHKSCEKEFMRLTFFCCVAVMMILTCLDTPHRDTPLLRWAMMKNTRHLIYFMFLTPHRLQQTPVTLRQFLTPLLYFILIWNTKIIYPSLTISCLNISKSILRFSIKLTVFTLVNVSEFLVGCWLPDSAYVAISHFCAKLSQLAVLSIDFHFIMWVSPRKLCISL